MKRLQPRSSSWLEWYRVDNVPLPLRPLYFTITHLFGNIQYYVIHKLVNCTSSIAISGSNPMLPKTPCIYAVWHSEVYAFFSSFERFPDMAILNHPYWYMKPTHIAMQKLGIKEIYLGSSGSGGMEALNQLAERLQKGDRSSFINPDGPSGPVGSVKKGILILAFKSGLPIVPVRIRSSSHHIRIHSSWDRKMIPLPFGKIHVTFSDPIWVSSETEFAEVKLKLEGALGPPLE